MYLDDSAAQIEVFEGKVAWLYRDTRGNVTCAVGKMLPNVEAALALPFCTVGVGEPATDEDVRRDWNRVIALPFGPKYGADFYRNEDSVFLGQAEIDALLMEVLSACDGELAEEYPGYAGFPDCVKMALLDMDYNLGDTKLRKTYPRFDAAVDAKDWLTAAAECLRQGIPAARNTWTTQQFKQALAGVE